MFALKSNIFPLFSFFRKVFSDGREEVFLGFKASILVNGSILSFNQKGSWFIQKGSWFVQKGSWFIQKGSWFIQWNFYFNKKPPSLNKLSHLFIWKSIENIHEHSPPFVGYF